MAKRDPSTLKSQAATALDKGKHKKALQAYLDIEHLEPDDGQWPRRAADMYRRLGKKGAAILALERAADKYLRAGFLVKAIAVCKMILQLDPEHSEVKERLAALNAQRGIAEAPAAATSAQDAAPEPRAEAPAVESTVESTAATPAEPDGPDAAMAARETAAREAAAREAAAREAAARERAAREMAAREAAAREGAAREAAAREAAAREMAAREAAAREAAAREMAARETAARERAAREAAARGAAGEDPARLPRTAAEFAMELAATGPVMESRPEIAIPDRGGIDQFVLEADEPEPEIEIEADEPEIEIEADEPEIEIEADEPETEPTPEPTPEPAGIGRDAAPRIEPDAAPPAAEPAMEQVRGHDAEVLPASSVRPVQRTPQVTPAGVVALAEQHTRRTRPRTIPPDVPLEAVTLSDVVPGAVADLDDDGNDSGIIEIPLEEIELIPDGVGPEGELALRRTPLLSALGPDAMRQLIAEVSLVELAPGQVLFREGEPGRTLYVIAEGAVQVISEGPPRVHLSELGEGDFFGEIAIVTNQPRTATIAAHPERGAQLLAMDRNMLGDLIENEPAVLQALLRFLRDRLVDRLVQVSPLFAPYVGSEGHDLASRFRFLEVHSGTVLLQQGHRASGLFVLLAGQLEVVHSGEQGARRLGTLRPGGVFGEMSLLANQPAVFTVRATSKSFILQLPAAVFREVIMTHPQVLMYVAEVAEERRSRYQAIVAGDADYEVGGINLL